MKLLFALAAVCAMLAASTGVANASASCSDDAYQSSANAAMQKMNVAMSEWDSPVVFRAYSASGLRIMRSAPPACSAKLRSTRSHLLTVFADNQAAFQAEQRGDHTSALKWLDQAKRHVEYALAAIA